MSAVERIRKSSPDVGRGDHFHVNPKPRKGKAAGKQKPRKGAAS